MTARSKMCFAQTSSILSCGLVCPPWRATLMTATLRPSVCPVHWIYSSRRYYKFGYIASNNNKCKAIRRSKGQRSQGDWERKCKYVFAHIIFISRSIYDATFCLLLRHSVKAKNPFSVSYALITRLTFTLFSAITRTVNLSLIHIWSCRRIERCRSRWSPYH